MVNLTEYLDLLLNTFAMMFVQMVFLHSVLPARESGWRTKFWVQYLVILVPLLVLGYLVFFHYGVKFLLNILLLFGLCQFLFAGKWWYTLLMSVMAFLVFFGSEFIFLSVVYLINGTNYLDFIFSFTMPQRMLMQALNLFLVSTLLFLCAALVRQKGLFLPRREFLLFSILPISQSITFIVFGCYALTNPSAPIGASVVTLVSLIASIIADIFIFCSMTRLTKTTQTETQNYYLREQQELQLKYYAALAEQQDAVRKMRHDITNHLIVMQSMLQSGRTAETEEYRGRLQAQYNQQTRIDYCQHPALDAILHSKASFAASLGIQLAIHAEARSDLPIDSVDLVCVAANLLDSAVEVVAGGDGAYLSFAASEQQGTFVLEAESSPVGRGRGAPPRPHTPHGLGLDIVASVAEKYNGSFEAVQEAASFRATAFLPL